MKIEYLEYLLAVYETRSLNKASKLLLTSPQNISRVMKKLEAELQINLFQRMPHGVLFTIEGKDAVLYAKKVVALSDEYKKLLHKKRENLNYCVGELVIVSTRAQYIAFLNDIVLEFKKVYPKIKISSIETDFLNALKLIDQNHNYVGVLPNMVVRGFSIVPSEFVDKLCFTKLNYDEICVIANKDSPISKQKSISFKALANYNIAIFVRNKFEDSFYVQILDHYMDKKNISFISGNWYTDGYTYYKKIVQDGLVGLTSKNAFISSDYYQNEINRNSISMISIRGEKQISNNIVIKCNICLETHITHFLDYLKSKFDSIYNE